MISLKFVLTQWALLMCQRDLPPPSEFKTCVEANRWCFANDKQGTNAIDCMDRFKEIFKDRLLMASRKGYL